MNKREILPYILILAFWGLSAYFGSLVGELRKELLNQPKDNEIIIINNEAYRINIRIDTTRLVREY
jgi:hypothetical protein